MLGEYGLGERTVEINRVAAQIARRVCDRFEQETGIPRFVAGSIGPSGKLPSGNDPDLSNISFEALAAIFYEQAKGLVEGGDQSSQQHGGGRAERSRRAVGICRDPEAVPKN
jgi:5-methyltetrahydrofolate--homocysteine methyltransferase